MKKSILIYCCISASLVGIVLYRKNKEKILKKDNRESFLPNELVEETVNLESKLAIVPDGPELIKVHNKNDAISIVEGQLGNNNGDWIWNCLWDDDEKFFVKAISKTALAKGAMTGTAYTAFVYRDGSIKEDLFELKLK
ncbi:hypothetical protein [Liquorilactobacillus satsumensis]|uniref:hypothetical protein n=1 Tax=Liquorilactobacillus satsumensis TaxID=259059 RepID=UPI0039E8172A